MKPVLWLGSSRRDLRDLPEEARRNIGLALFVAQTGGKHPKAKVLSGFAGAGVLEVIEQDDGRAFRAVYTVRFSEAVIVVHCFEKKSKSGIAMPRQDIELIRSRLQRAEEMYNEWLKNR